MFEFISAGGYVMWLLIACSILSLAITIERSFFWLRQKNPISFSDLQQLLNTKQDCDQENIDENWRKDKSLFTKVVAYAVDQKEYGLTKTFEYAARLEIERMKHGLGILDTVITIAPLLGILGTVLGIIDSFEVLTLKGIKEPSAVVAGISKALVTTAAGLLVAIITVIPFNYFVRRVEKATSELESIGSYLESTTSKG